MSVNLKRPEILAPVGTPQMLVAAIHNGADAVYIGMPYFNARGRTPDYSIAELKEMVDLAHLYGVRVLLACNVLIFEAELTEVAAILAEVLPLGIDALIVQDLGLVRLIKTLAPHQVVHASTQMTVSNAESITLTADLDMQRYVLARELSLQEVKRIREQTTKELEVFVHGALCVSYSGQCLTSESHGGRSANRGQCAQSCRLSYDLIVDGVQKELGAKRHLVSPQDLCGIEDVARLLDAGVDSFKIEGRYKSPEYVASAARNYREVCEEVIFGSAKRPMDERLHELGLTFARGHFNGWFDGVDHQRLVDARFSRPQGHLLGEVVAIDGAFIDVATQHTLEVGDGIVFQDFESHRECGGIVFSARLGAAGSLRVRLDRAFDTRSVTVGMLAFHNSSGSVDKKLRATFTDRAKFKKVPVTATLTGEIGAPLSLRMTDDSGNTVTVTSEQSLAAARTSALTNEEAREEFSSLTGTPFQLQTLEFSVQGRGFIHHRELKQLRRNGVAALSSLRTKRESPITSAWSPQVYERLRGTNQIINHAQSASTLNVLLRDESQVEALAGLPIGWVYLDFEFNKDYNHALERVRQLGFKCAIATTRILKPGEHGHLSYIKRLKPDAILVRNLGALQILSSSNIPLFGDFSLNVSNSLTAAYLLGKGLQRLTPSYDLNQQQLLDLVGASSAPALEVTVHQYMPAFHMEHCVFAAFLSNGSSYRDCGRPCEKHRVELRDPDGTLHPLKPDAECRNTMFQGKPQSAVRLIPSLLAQGVVNFRLEALFENPEQLRLKAQAYSDVVQGRAAVESVFERLGIVERYGVTEGQLFNERVYRDKKKPSLSVLAGG